jgi:hypothetical protein
LRKKNLLGDEEGEREREIEGEREVRLVRIGTAFIFCDINMLMKYIFFVYYSSLEQNWYVKKTA